VTPLGERLAALIAANGPITVADYMALCLGDPEHGYYMARDPFGRGGDFVTAPEVSQVFGELIGLWAVATFEAMGSPSSFVLAELGPGRGTLMADLLRAARVRPAFLDAAQVQLVETSPRLRAVQEATLGPTAVAWHDALDSLPRGPAIVVANEFFDALPIRQFVRTTTGWAERMVGLDDAGGLAFGLRPLEAPLSSFPPSPSFRRKPESIAGLAARPNPQDKMRQGSRWTPAFAGVTELVVTADAEPSIFETSPVAIAIMSSLAARVAVEGGAALIIDYGCEGPAFGDTLQAVRGHAYADPLAEPGEADLTAHVDFAALARAAVAAGAEPRRLVSQGDFLSRLGIGARAERLAAGKDDVAQATIASAVARLIAPEAMGDLFKVLALSHSGLALPAFDGDA
jgi:NADH dehydrogenase [ubiquinone] 1 alpha subcomplex assembly factor 7